MALALLAAGIARAAAPDGIDDLGAARAARLMAREKRALTAAARKLDTRLRPLAWPVRKTSPRSPLVAAAPMQHVADGRVRVYVRLAALDEDALARLGAAGVEVEMVDRAGGRAQAVVDARQLRDLAALPSVLAIRPAERGRLRTGSVTKRGRRGRARGSGPRPRLRWERNGRRRDLGRHRSCRRRAGDRRPARGHGPRRCALPPGQRRRGHGVARDRP